MAKYVCEVVIEIKEPVTKKSLRAWIPEKLMVLWTSGDVGFPTDTVTKVRVRAVDFD